MSIVDEIGVPALLEQTAEECCELAHACLKMARKIRDENPTPKSIEDIRDELEEEAADVKVCLNMLVWYTDILNGTDLYFKMNEKEHRWYERMDMHLDLEEDDVIYSD